MLSDSDVDDLQAAARVTPLSSPASQQAATLQHHLTPPPQQFAAPTQVNDASLQAALVAAQHVLNQIPQGAPQPVRPRSSHNNAKPPPPVQLEPPEAAPDNWKIWKELYENYTVVSRLDVETHRYQRSFLISTMGKEALQLYNRCNPIQTDTAQDIISKLDELILGTLNETFERYKFNTRSQKPGESIDMYVGDLKILARTCGFCTCTDLKDTLVRDRIILGVSDLELRKVLLHERNLSLEKCVDIAKAYESTSTHMKVLSKDITQGINKLSTAKHQRKAPKDARKPHSQQPRSQQQMLKCCLFCAQSHVKNREMCPAWGKICNKCNRKNHFSQCCSNYKKYQSTKKYQSRSRVHQLEGSSDSSEQCGSVSSESDVACVTDICAINESTGPLFAEMSLENTKRPVTFQIDCGATVNVIHKGLIGDVKLKRTKTVLRMYNKSLIYPLGKCKITLKNPITSQQYYQTFQVVDQELVPLLSRAAAENMNLITVNYENFKQIHAVTDTITGSFKSVFAENALGTLPGNVHLTVEENANPIQCPPRCVPVALKKPLKSELDSMVKRGVIVPVTEPTDWCSQISIQKKRTGKLRICLDPRRLNKVLKRERYPLPTLDDVLPDLTTACVLSKVDLQNGYWHCSLDEQSSKLTTFITPYGRFRWCRLPFGLNVSSEIFQRKLTESIAGLEGVVCVADDILIYGKDDDEHDRRLQALLERCAEKQIKLHPKKCAFKQTELDFLGHVITTDGLKPDKKKIEGIMNMPKPTDAAGVLRLQGTVNYLARFLKDLSTVFEPIRRLTKKDEEWNWAEEQDRAFEKIKNIVSAAPILKYYDAAKDLTIQCDASSTGLGATLLQDDHPLAYVSRALTPTERNYSQMEKECLAIVFSSERFHQYTFGRQTIVHSDHKPLESIMRKPLSKAPKRLQAMMLRLMQYDLEIVYKQGTELHIADMLSRAHADPDPDQKTCFGNINAVSHLRVSKKTAKALKETTSQDDVMKLLKEVIINGWPEKKDDVPVQIAPYFSFRDELTVHDGLIMKGERIVIPKAERHRIKERIHSSHLGQGSALRRARECVYWPGMTDEIRQMVETCETCNTYQAAQQKQTLQTTLPEAEYPWQKVGVDLFSVKGKDYLVTVCYTSGFWEIDKLKSTRSTAVIYKLKSHFARFGIPDQLVSDNGPQFACDEFAKFTDSWDIEHFTSSPGHARANGKAEAAVKQAKHMIQKCEKSGSDPMLALLEIRNTPQQDASSSPAQRLLNRRTRTLIPTTSELLKPRGEEIMKKDRQIMDKAVKSREKQYNKTAKDLKPLEEGDVVRMKPFQLGDKEWKKAIVTKRLDDRSYDIETNQGVLRRTREDLRKTKEQMDNESVNKKPMIIVSHGENNTAASTTTEPIKSPLTPPQTPNQPAVLHQDTPLAAQNPPSKTATKPPIPSVVPKSPVVRRSSRMTKGQAPSRYKDFDMKRK